MTVDGGKSKNFPACSKNWIIGRASPKHAFQMNDETETSAMNILIGKISWRNILIRDFFINTVNLRTYVRKISFSSEDEDKQATETPSMAFIMIAMSNKERTDRNVVKQAYRHSLLPITVIASQLPLWLNAVTTLLTRVYRCLASRWLIMVNKK